jgi:hypothetical protein
MPCLAGDDRVEGPPSRIPIFEPCHLDFEPAPASELGHAFVGLDSEDPAPTLPEGQS